MFYIAPMAIIGQTFQKPSAPGTPIDYKCIGYGQNPDSGAMFIVGADFDSASNRTEVSTHLLKDIKFKGELPDATPKTS